jgi:hypothetical protein
VIRAWEAAVEMGDYVMAMVRPGHPQRARSHQSLLADNGWIDATLAEDLKRTGEFCRAEWDYQAAPLPALVTIIKRGLDDFDTYARALLARAAELPAPPSADAPAGGDPAI